MNVRIAGLGAALALACAATAHAQVPAGLRDAAARIDYGWYTGDGGLILAARESLSASAREPWSLYLRAYAAYRTAELRLAFGAAAGEELADCTADAESAAANESVAAEASVLAVACSAMAASAEPLRAVLHQRRLRQGLEQAQVTAAGNPRLALVRLKHLDDAGIEVDTIVAAFREQRGRSAFPDWGDAEALLLQCEQRLAAGNLRGARDALEEALLIAPDYTAALDLKAQIGALTAAN